MLNPPKPSLTVTPPVESKYANNGVWCIPSPLEVIKLHPQAEAPYKPDGRHQDPYWHLTVVSRSGNRVDDIQGGYNEFETGLCIKCPKHYHLEIFEHPDLYKAGYSMSPRILSPNATDEQIMLPLYKFNDGEDLSLPFPVAIIVMRETQYTTIAAVSNQPVQQPMFNGGYGARAAVPAQLEFDLPSAQKKTHRSRVKTAGKSNTNNHFS